MWDNNCQATFDFQKNPLVDPPILQYPDFDKQFLTEQATANQGHTVTDTNITVNTEMNDINNHTRKNPLPITVTDDREKKLILYEYHYTLVGRHTGTWRIYQRMKLKYVWPKMIQDIKKYVNSCKICTSTNKLMSTNKHKRA